MSPDETTVYIEQKLQEPARFLVFTVDDAMAFACPLVVGWLGKQLLVGVVAGIVLYSLWKRLKGEGGLSSLKAAAYWWVPREVTPFRAFPDSAVSFWRG